MTTLATMNSLLPPAPTRSAAPLRSRLSAVPEPLQLSERFWKAVKLDSPSSPGFDAAVHDVSSPIDSKLYSVVDVDDVTFIDDPIVAFEVNDCYSPRSPGFCDPSHHEQVADSQDYRPCPYGEQPELPTTPGPTVASLRCDNLKPASKGTSSWSPTLLLPARFRRPSLTLNTRQAPSVLSLASAFLDSVVRLARSRNTTPTTFNDGQGPVTIMDSEIYINVIEDGKRTGNHGDAVRPVYGMDVSTHAALAGLASPWLAQISISSNRPLDGHAQTLDARGEMFRGRLAYRS